MARLKGESLYSVLWGDQLQIDKPEEARRLLQSKALAAVV